MIHLIRHTQVEGDGLCYGRFEPDLSPTFNEEAWRLKTRLPSSVGVAYSSPAARCLKLAGALDLPAIRSDTRLQELNFGEWEGKPWLSFRGPQSEKWVQNPWDLAPPGGERLRDLWARVTDFRQELLTTACHQQEAVVVTHAGVIRAWLAQVEQVDWRTSLNRPLAFGQVISLPAP